MSVESTGSSGRYDCVIFGASGFTGRYVVQELMESLKMFGLKHSFAVAGRNKSKLQETLQIVEEASGLSMKNIPVLVADVSDEKSLGEMAKKSKIVINCVGPYDRYGEQVVQACIWNKASHLDISGEPLFLDRMQVKYSEEAEQAGVYVVGSCGFDSIPTDMGVVFLSKNFPGQVNSIETYFSSSSGPEGYSIHTGTWHSLLNAMGNPETKKILRDNRRILFPKKLPKAAHPLKSRVLHQSPVASGWALPFPSCDQMVVRRSQYYLWDKEGLRPIQVRCYVHMGSLLAAILGTLWGGALFFGSKFGPLRRIMEKNPSLFSAGKFTSQGPSRSQIEGARFRLTLIGEGWKGATVRPSAPDTTLVAEVNGPDAGYKATSACLVQSALTILEEPDKLPKKGGVFPPGAAFHHTQLVERLIRRGVRFAVKTLK